MKPDFSLPILDFPLLCLTPSTLLWSELHYTYFAPTFFHSSTGLLTFSMLIHQFNSSMHVLHNIRLLCTYFAPTASKPSLNIWNYSSSSSTSTLFIFGSTHLLLLYFLFVTNVSINSSMPKG